MVAIHLVCFAKLRHDETCKPGGVPALVAREPHQGEFIAAEADDGIVRTGAGLQARSHGTQQRVTHRVAARVVDLLEPVQVDQEYHGSHALAGAHSTGAWP